MPDFDISVVLNLHDERQYLNRTLLSLSEAATYAWRVGISVQLIAVLDRSDEATAGMLRSADLRAFNDVRIVEVDNGSLGLSRNCGCRLATGTYIATADGDDLVSFNYFERMFFESRRGGQRVILVPKFYLGFGSSYHICEFFDLDLVTPLTLIKSHPFVSRIFFHCSLLEHLAFEDVRLSRGYAYEDWHFNCNAVALGYAFYACEETVVFYRQRETSLLARAYAVSARQIPPSALFAPDRYLAACARFLPDTERDSGHTVPPATTGRAMLDDPIYRETVIAASHIDPAVDIGKLRESNAFNYLSADRDLGVAYAAVCRVLRGKTFDEIFLMPFLTTGGADRYLLDVMSAIAHARPAVSMLVLFGEPFAKYAWLDRLPPGTVHFDLCGKLPSLSEEDADILCLKIIQSVGRDARLHLKGSRFAERFFSRFGHLLGEHRPVVYRFCDGRMVFDGSEFIESGQFDFMSENIEWLDRAICDNAGIMAFDRQRLGIAPEKWSLLYARVALPPQFDDTRIDAAGASRTVLWASRIDRQKRAGLLARIAELLAERLPDVRIDVYGAATLDDAATDHLAGLPNVRRHGAFSRFDDIGAGAYYCFVYTSSFDGMPNVLLEAAAAGTAIVAPDVGGIGEFVRDGETGLIVDCAGDDETDAHSYVAAIERLFADPALRRSMIKSAFRLLEERHSPKSYQATAARLFGLDAPRCQGGDDGVGPGRCTSPVGEQAWDSDR